MLVCTDIESVRKYRSDHQTGTLGLVPTMGFLHQGHLSLVKRACKENRHTGVSIFVNPIQFNDTADLHNYPRDESRDLSLLENEGVDLVWLPAADEVYPEGFQSHVEVSNITRYLEGAARPGHFRGVTTIVTKLLNIFRPGRVYFGQKDAQQVAVIQRMVSDLNIPVEIVVCETVREPDGLAMSSRNSLLSHQARKQAVCLFQALTSARDAIIGGERQAESLRQLMKQTVQQHDLARIDYVSVADPGKIEELVEIDGAVLLSMAVYMDGVRLIDNLLINEIR
jgi:pantoate--beta-alanine ligase